MVNYFHSNVTRWNKLRCSKGAVHGPEQEVQESGAEGPHLNKHGEVSAEQEEAQVEDRKPGRRPGRWQDHHRARLPQVNTVTVIHLYQLFMLKNRQS